MVSPFRDPGDNPYWKNFDLNNPHPVAATVAQVTPDAMIPPTTGRRGGE